MKASETIKPFDFEVATVDLRPNINAKTSYSPTRLANMVINGYFQPIGFS